LDDAPTLLDEGELRLGFGRAHAAVAARSLGHRAGHSATGPDRAHYGQTGDKRALHERSLVVTRKSCRDVRSLSASTEHFDLRPRRSQGLPRATAIDANGGNARIVSDTYHGPTDGEQNELVAYLLTL
jgi:hypothetical protein